MFKNKVLIGGLVVLLVVIVFEVVVINFRKNKRQDSDANTSAEVEQANLSPTPKIVETPPVYEISIGNVIQIEVIGRIEGFDNEYWLIGSEAGQRKVLVIITGSKNFMLFDGEEFPRSVSYSELIDSVSLGDKIVFNDVKKQDDQKYVSQGGVLVDKIGDLIKY